MDINFWLWYNFALYFENMGSSTGPMNLGMIRGNEHKKGIEMNRKWLLFLQSEALTNLRQWVYRCCRSSSSIFCCADVSTIIVTDNSCKTQDTSWVSYGNFASLFWPGDHRVGYASRVAVKCNIGFMRCFKRSRPGHHFWCSWDIRTKVSQKARTNWTWDETENWLACWLALISQI